MTFHPGHDALHGFTVVVETKGPLTYVGRWDAEENGLVRLLDVAQHQVGEGGMDRAAYLADVARNGPRPTHRMTLVPAAEIATVRTLGDLCRDLRGR